MPLLKERIKTPSHCTKCGRRLGVLDLVPGLSWVFLGGKCRFCKTGISVRYPAVDLLNGLLWLICVLVFGPVPFLPVALALSTCLLTVAFIDLETYEIPDGLNIFIVSVGTLWNIYALIAGYDILLENIIGFFSVSVLLLIIAILSKGGMGGGDIKLSTVCGLILGWQNMVLAICIASILGAVVMLPVFIIKKKERRTPIPFGPFMAAGIFISMCFGNVIIKTYLDIFLY
ncbi:MAG: prepilin peptidase [Clostridiales bacterium]|jgi:leader peptidase (prepilin peptidase)/N-methyltransferase|nr:prepilin peptidase [Clostridiales bacterium]